MLHERNLPPWAVNHKRERRARQDAALEEAAEIRRSRQAEKDAKYRYLPASYRAFDELAEAAGQEVAEKVKALVEEMLKEYAGNGDTCA